MRRKVRYHPAQLVPIEAQPTRNQRPYDMTNELYLSEDFRQRWSEPVDLDRLMQIEGEVFRQVARRRTLKFELGGKAYFIKIHRGVGWAEIIKNLLQLRWPVLGAQNEYQAILRLQKLGVETMTLAAYGKRGQNPAELESLVVTESLEQTISLEDVVLQQQHRPVPLRLKRALLTRVAKMASALHTNGLNHRDLYICHFLLHLLPHEKWPDSNDFHLYLIDLHRVQIRKRTPERWVVKDVAALHFSSMGAGLTLRDRLRFIRAYSDLPLRQALQNQSEFWAKVEQKAQALLAKPIKG